MNSISVYLKILWSQSLWKMQGSSMEINVRRSPQVFETKPMGGLQWLCLLRWRASQEVKSQWLHLFEWDRISRSPGVGVWKKFLGAPDNQQVVSEQSERTGAEQSEEVRCQVLPRCFAFKISLEIHNPGLFQTSRMSSGAKKDALWTPTECLSFSDYLRASPSQVRCQE